MQAKYAESGFIFIISILIVIVLKDDPFFWDTVQLGSKHAHWYFEHSFKHIFLPQELDSGHIPFFGFYLALWWSLLGKSLFVSHLAMLPFIFIMISSSIGIVRVLGIKNSFPLPILLVLSDPTLVAQASLISPDLVLTALFLMALSFILNNRKCPLLFIYVALVLISNRGIVSIITLNAIYLTYHYLKGSLKLQKLIFQSVLLVAPAAIVFLLYHVSHYNQLGWVFYHIESPWAPSFERVTAEDSFYNLGLMIWRYIDFGRVSLVIVCTTLVLYNLVKIKSSVQTKSLLLGFVAFVIFSSIITLPYTHLTGHRYYLPGFLMIAIICSKLLTDTETISAKTKNLLFVFIIFSNCFGHQLAYPDTISQGWDASLAYRAHLHQQKLIIDYLDANNIPVEQVGSSFPNLSWFKYYHLSENRRHFSPKDLSGEQQYIYYTNICNDFSDRELETLKNEYRSIFKLESSTVHSYILKKVANTSSDGHL